MFHHRSFGSAQAAGCSEELCVVADAANSYAWKEVPCTQRHPWVHVKKFTYNLLLRKLKYAQLLRMDSISWGNSEYFEVGDAQSLQIPVRFSTHRMFEADNEDKVYHVSASRIYIPVCVYNFISIPVLLIYADVVTAKTNGCKTYTTVIVGLPKK